MALSRQQQEVRLPADFGLGLAVTTVLGGLLLLLCAFVLAVPSQGPRGESRAPDFETTYRDISADTTAPIVLPTP